MRRTKKEQLLWPKKCKMRVKTKINQHIAKNIKINSRKKRKEKSRKKNRKSKYFRSRKSARAVVGTLGDKGVKGMLKKEKEITEKLNEFFSSVFPVDKVGQIPAPELTFLGMEFEENSGDKR